MKKIVILFLLVGLWGSVSSKTPQRFVRIYGPFPVEKLILLQTVTKDTLIFSKTDTVYEHAWQWGIFYSHRYRKPCLVNRYHSVKIVESSTGTEVMLVYTNDYTSESKPIGSYTSDPLSWKWTFFCSFLVMHSLVFYFLRLRILYIYDGTVYRYVAVPHQRRKTIISVVVVILITAFLFGWLVKSYFLFFSPLLYSIFIFLPERIWKRSIINQ